MECFMSDCGSGVGLICIHRLGDGQGAQPDLAPDQTLVLRNGPARGGPTGEVALVQGQDRPQVPETVTEHSVGGGGR